MASQDEDIPQETEQQEVQQPSSPQLEQSEDATQAAVDPPQADTEQTEENTSPQSPPASPSQEEQSETVTAEQVETEVNETVSSPTQDVAANSPEPGSPTEPPAAQEEVPGESQLETQDAEEPTAADDGKAEPSTEQEPISEPATEQEPVSEPAAEQEPVSEPATEQEPMTEPALEQEPVTETQDEQEPVTEQEPVSEPATEQEPVSEPATEQEPAPAAPEQEPGSPKEPSPGTEPSAPPLESTPEPPLEEEPMVAEAAKAQMTEGKALEQGTGSDTIPTPPPPMPVQGKTSEEKIPTDALNLVWTFGMNKSVPVINLTDDTRRMIMYASAHTGVLYDFHGNQQLLLQGHANDITCTCCSADKRWLATADAGPDNMVIVWDSYTGIPVKNIFDPHPAGVVALAMTPDAKFLAMMSGGANQIFSIWEWTLPEDNPVCSVELKESFGVQNYVYFNPYDPNQIVSNSDSQVIFYYWEGSELVYEAPPLSDEDFNKPVGRFSQSVYQIDGTRALSGTSQGNLVVWETNKMVNKSNKAHVADKKALKLVKLQDRSILVLTTIDQFIVAGDTAGHIKFLDQTLKLVQWYQDFHIGAVTALSFAYLPDFDPKAIRGDYPPDSTLKAQPFIICDFVVGTSTAVYAHVATDGTEVKVIHNDHDSAVYALAAHPSETRLAVGSYSGFLKIWDYKTKVVLVSRVFERGSMIRCCAFDHVGDYIAVGFTNGAVRILNALTLDDVLPDPLRFAKDAITHVVFSHDGKYLATADGDHTVMLVKRERADSEDFVYLGRYRSHYKTIHDLVFGEYLDSNAPRLLSLGQDRVLVEYDLENSSKEEVRLLSTERIEQSAVPHCLVWYPPVTKESFLLTANDQYKYKLYNSTTKMCRSTLLGPTYGSPLQKMVVLPSEDPLSTQRHLAYITRDKVGLQSLPIDGNPHDSMALVAHPRGVGNMVCSYDGQYVFTAGGVDTTVQMWDVCLKALDVQSKLGGEDLIPFYGLLDGGREGQLFRELEDFFYYAQIRSQGVNTMETKKVSTVVPIDQVPYLMRALGFYPSEQEIDDMLNEVKFSNYVETGQYTTEIDLGNFIRLYVNHRPAFGLQPDQLTRAFEELGEEGEQPAIHRSDLLHILQNRGEHMTEMELAEYLTTLLGYNPEGGSIELQEFDTETAGDIIDENLPHNITADMFANDLLGFGMYADVLNVENEEYEKLAA